MKTKRALAALVVPVLATISSNAFALAAQPPEPELPEADGQTYIDLGNEDATTSLHSSYGISSTSLSSSYVRIPVTSIVLPDVCDVPKKTTDFTRTWSKAGDFGNSTVGAGYTADLVVTSKAGRGTDPDKISADAKLRAFATIFGLDVNLVTIDGYGELKGTKGYGKYYAYVRGVDTWSGSGTEKFEGTKTSTHTFFSAKKTIWLGPLPISVTGAAKGEVGITYRVAYEQGVVNMTANPWARAYLTASAGVDVWLASAGISGELDLVRADVPSRARVYITPTDMGYTLDSDVTLKSLAGRIQVYGCLTGSCWKKDIASWSPLYNSTYRFIHLGGCTNPVQRLVCGNGTCENGESYTNCPQDCAAPPPPPPPSTPDTDGSICDLYPWKCSP